MGPSWAKPGQVSKVRKEKMAPLPPLQEQGELCALTLHHLPPCPPRLPPMKLPTVLNRCDFKFKAEVTDLDPKAFKGKGMLPCLTV